MLLLLRLLTLLLFLFYAVSCVAVVVAVEGVVVCALLVGIVLLIFISSKLSREHCDLLEHP